MKIVRIWGASYSGSTAVGYALNTVPGYFFGSEVRRIVHAANEGLMFPECDLCGSSCKYWNGSLFQELSARTSSLRELYEKFGERHKEIDVFVDGSKLPSFYKGVNTEFNIVSVKHPIRLLSSYMYNKRRDLGIETRGFKELGEYISSNIPKMGSVIDEYFAFLKRKYHSFGSALGGEMFWFHVDRAHRLDFQMFRDFEQYVGLEEFAIDERNFSSYPCHSIGGNRAPVWAAQQKYASVEKLKDPRKKYYLEQRKFGDWKIDNKYEDVIVNRTLDYCLSLKSYGDICEYFGYSKEVIEEN